MNYFNLTYHDVANGPGVRVVLGVSGCSIKCPGCHNPHAQDFCVGEKFDDYAMTKLKEGLRLPETRGLTVTGGHPLEHRNIFKVREILHELNEEFPNKDIWLYTGLILTDDDFIRDGYLSATLKECDVVVDGPYVEEERDITLAHRGSRNQRLIDVKKTLENKKITLLTL